LAEWYCGYSVSDKPLNDKEQAMTSRQSWVIGASIIAGCLILGAFLGRPSAAEEKTVVAGSAAAPVVGRYQIVQSNPQNRSVVVLDTATGHCWSINDNYEPKDWHDLGSPVKDKKE
jgi:hypothetical protein